MRGDKLHPPSPPMKLPTILVEKSIADCHADVLSLFDGSRWESVDAFLWRLDRSDNNAVLRNSLDKCDNSGETLLHRIATTGSELSMTWRWNLFRWLMDEYPELYERRNRSKTTILGLAIRWCDETIFQLIQA